MPNKIIKYLPLAIGLLTSGIVIALINRDYPYIGHDYRYFLPRLLDTKLHILINGPVVQWYTPSFGGGLPAYPNPQHIEYSLVQFIAILTDPWRAVLISTFFISLTGFMVFEKFLRETLGLHWSSSMLGAIFFIGNGFFIEHMIVGHLGYQLFPLGALLLWVIVEQRVTMLKAVACIALIFALLIHQAGFYLIVILGLSLWIALPLIHIYRSDIIKLQELILKASLGLFLGGLMASSKVAAVIAMMRLFPRIVSDSYSAGILQALIGLTAQFFGVMVFVPILRLVGQNTSLLAGALATLTGAQYGLWELDQSLSPVLLILLGLSLTRYLSLLRTRTATLRVSKVTWLILILGVWITTEITLSKGIFYPVFRQLPIIQSLHVNVRFAASFILPLVLLGACEYDRFSHAKRNLPLSILATALALAFLFFYNLLPAEVHSRYLDLTTLLQANRELSNGEKFSIKSVEVIPDEMVFTAAATSLRPYEPLFGYALNDFTSQVQPGPVTTNDGIYFNLTNPASLVFPEENSLQPFERIKVTQQVQLQDFIERRQPKWKLPPGQVIANWISLAALLATFGLLAWAAKRR